MNNSPNECLLPTTEPTDTDNYLFSYDPYIDSPFLSKIFFTWCFSLLKHITSKPLTLLTSLYPTTKHNNISTFTSSLMNIWHTRKYKSKHSNALFKAILRANMCEYLIILFLLLISNITDYVSVIYIKKFIDSFSSSTPSTSVSLNSNNSILYKHGCIYIALQFIYIITSKQASIKQKVSSLRSKFSLCCFIFDKVFKISPSTSSTSEGKIIQFIQTDSNQLSFFVTRAPSAIIVPITLICYVVLLFKYFGIAFIAGFAVLLFVMFINYSLFKEYSCVNKMKLGKGDSRLKLITEVFSNIKMVKLNNMEQLCNEKIRNAREHEVEYIKKTYQIWTRNISLFWLCPTLAAIATFGVYQLLYDGFTIGTMLIGLAIFGKLQTPIRTLPDAINSIIDTLQSLKRIEEFIHEKERDGKVIHVNENNSNSSSDDDEEEDYAIKINKGCFTWGKSASKDNKPSTSLTSNQQQSNTSTDVNAKAFTLENISFTINKGEFIGIIGEVGSGKSTLFQAILNNLTLTNPTECNGVYINGKLAYVPQVSWIQNESIRNNILFFKEYNEALYNNVIDITQLNQDINVLDNKDMTEIGEKGVNLSGGQKLRISLARALYSEADIYLLDDPFSALDSYIGGLIMEKCLLGHIKYSTRILITHSLQYLKYVDRVIVMEKGKVKWIGKYKELCEQPFYESFNKLVLRNKKEVEDVLITNASDTEAKSVRKGSVNSKTITKINQHNTNNNNIITKEKKESGSIKYKVYKRFFFYLGGTCFSILIIIVMFFWQLTKAGSDLWLSYWSSQLNSTSTSILPAILNIPSIKQSFFLIYSILGISSIFFIFLRVCLLTIGVTRLSRTLHHDMITSLLHSPLNLFHDTVPKGQIYNRLSKDLSTLEYNYFTVGNLLSRFFNIFGSILICSLYDSYSVVFILLITSIGLVITNFYLKGSRELSRVDSMSRSPILSTLNETLPGRDVIIAYKQEKQYKTKYYNLINNALKFNLCFNGVSCWHTEQFNLLSIVYVVYLVITMILFSYKFTPQSVGMMLTYSMVLEKNLSLLFITYSEFENNMIAMERCVQYTELRTEKERTVENDKLLKAQQWPKHGKVEFKSYSMRYRPGSEIVLKDISLTINPGEKVGVVGRTGSGKSSLCLGLFRIVEPLAGEIYIDGVNITKIGLDILRENISIVPQEPSLLSGTIRNAIDPSNKYSDNEIKRILELIGYNGNMLEFVIEKNGDNLSLGEKQLICFARAILRKCKVLVLDEATASVDLKTEEKIQELFNTILKNCTVITVAHRIKTVINCDKVIVFDEGKVVECDTPNNLIENKNSIFYKLYSKSIITN